MQQYFTTPRCHPLASAILTLTRTPTVGPKSNSRACLAEKLDDLRDVLQNMRRQEAKYYTESFKRPLPWRPILIQWMFSVVDIFHLAPQIVPTALYYVDQCMKDHHLGSPAQATMRYQLLGLTCLELAIKVHDTKVFPLEDLVRMGQSGFSPAQVVAMEAQLLKHLGWNLHPPTPHCFVHQYGELLQRLMTTCPNSTANVSQIVERALLLVRRGLYEMALPPAILAYAAMLAAMEEFASCLSTALKQSFCVHVLQITGLSASSPGLAQAYQLMDNRKTRVASPTSVISTQSNFTSVQQQYTHSQAPISTTMPQTQPLMYQKPSSEPQHMPHSTNSAPSTAVEQPTMIYSAGEDLGFEVTLNPSEDLPDEFGGMSLNKFESSLSPRNVSGALSPERL